MLSFLYNILIGISLAAPIGPVNIAIIKRGLKGGFLPAFLVSLGAAAADATYLTAVHFGITHIISLPLVKMIIGIFGTGVLCYLGVISIKEFWHKEGFREVKEKKNGFLTGYVITITNPLAPIFWLGILGAANITLKTDSSFLSLINSYAIILGVILWFLFLSFLLHFGKKVVNENMMRYISLLSGVIIISFGIFLAYNVLL